jgi:hypothetical protein
LAIHGQRFVGDTHKDRDQGCWSRFPKARATPDRRIKGEWELGAGFGKVFKEF